MRVIVPIRRVLNPQGIVVHRRLRRIFINREEYVLDPADRCALEAALRIKDGANSSTKGTEVVVVSGQPEPNDDTMRRGLAMGADRAVYLTGDGFEEADDAVVVRALEATVQRLGGADLILTGAATLDTRQGQLGPRMAEVLGWPQVVAASSVEAASDGQLRAIRQDGDEYVLVETELPAVVTLLPDALKPRYPNGVRLISVYSGQGEVAAALEHWGVADLVDPEALSAVVEKRGRDFPPERERGVRLGGTLEEMAQAAADALRQRVRG